MTQLKVALLQADIRQAQAHLDELVDQLIIEAATVHVGERIRLGDDKTIIEVTRITPVRHDLSAITFTYFGRKVRKSGALHLNEIQIYSWELREVTKVAKEEAI